MEDSSFTDLMIDTDEYLVDDWEQDFSVIPGETTDHQSTKPGSGSESGSGFSLIPERPTKQMKVNSTSSSPSSSSSSCGSLTAAQVISFGCADPKMNMVETSFNFTNQANMDQNVGSKRKECGNNGGKREPHLMKEHVLAERKRRQKLNERLIALSALLPGLKKADKASVLEDAIKHLKQLQERVKKLEEERGGTKKMDQSVILVKRSQVYVDDDSSSYSSTCSAASPPASSLDEVSILKQTMPMIEARVSDRDLLIRIHCEKTKGCLIKILSSLEKFRLDVVNSFTLPFGSSTLVITILSKMDNKFSRPIEDVVKNIRLALAE
ncbi:Transcription factor NAI1 [Hirschfeldia incana]|nr:Transcription factor NAI1 [Hirschfeldia incana]